MKAEEVKTGRILQMTDGKGALEDADEKIFPATDELRETRRRGERVRFIVEEVTITTGESSEEASNLSIARIWRPGESERISAPKS